MANASDINWAPPIPQRQTGMGVGISLLSDALDQIMAKRQAEAAAKAKADADLRDKLMIDSRERERMAEENRHNLVGEGNAAQNLDLNTQRFAREGYGQAVPLIQAGEGTLARPFMQPPQSAQPSGHAMVADLLGESAGIAMPPLPPQGGAPPALSQPPPTWAGGGPPPLTPQDIPPPAPPIGGEGMPMAAQGPPPQAAPQAPQQFARGPIMDPLDALMQQRDAEQKTRKASDLADWQKARTPGKGAGQFDQQAYADVVSAMQSGGLGKETPEAAYTKRRQFLETQANENMRAAMAATRSASSHEDVAGSKGLTEFRRELKDFEQEHKMPDLQKKVQDLAAAKAMLDSGTGPGQLAAIEGFFRSAKGGQLTGFFLKAAQDHMSGMTGQVQSAIQKAQTGGFGERDLGVLRQVFETADAAERHQVLNNHNSFVHKFMNRTNYDYKANAVAAYNDIFTPLGMPPVADEAAPGMTLSGKKIAPTGPAAASPATGASPYNEDAADAILNNMKRRSRQ